MTTAERRQAKRDCKASYADIFPNWRAMGAALLVQIEDSRRRGYHGPNAAVRSWSRAICWARLRLLRSERLHRQHREALLP